MSTTTSASAFTGSSSARSASMASARLRSVGQRVAAPGALVAAHQHVGGRPRGTGSAPAGPGARSAVERRQDLVVVRAGAHHQRHLGRCSDPGAWASSATLGMSAGGRLSMTNQPRSSRLSAACERPAPDRPVITTNSLTGASLPVTVAPARACSTARRRSAPTGSARSTSSRGHGGGVGVLGRPGQEARRRRRLVHPLDDQAVPRPAR